LIPTDGTTKAAVLGQMKHKMFESSLGSKEKLEEALSNQLKAIPKLFMEKAFEVSCNFSYSNLSYKNLSHISLSSLRVGYVRLKLKLF
jgi:hypothetical protein